MTSHASLPDTFRSSEWPREAPNYSDRALLVARAAGVGVIIGTVAPWVSVMMLMVTGLGYHGLGVTTLILGAASGGALLATVAFVGSSIRGWRPTAAGLRARRR